MYCVGFNYRDNFFFLESFNLRHSLLMITLYHQIKIPNGFWCSQGLNSKSLIQLLEILIVELTGTHYRDDLLVKRYCIKKSWLIYKF